MSLIRAVSLFVILFGPTLNATYVYEANQSLIDLKTNYIATSYNMNAGDDAVSSVFNLDFTFTFYVQDFTSARMATYILRRQELIVMITHLIRYLKLHTPYILSGLI